MNIHIQKGRIYMERGPIKEIYLYGCYPTKGRSYLVTTNNMSKETCVYENTPTKGTYLYEKGTHKRDLSIWLLPY